MQSLSDIAVFVHVVRSGSFTAAAEKLGMSKSVVSKNVTRLESRLGARLLNRTTRRLSLTEAGQSFFEKSEHALDEIAEAEAEVGKLQGEPRGELRLNAPMSFGILHVAPFLQALLRRYPQLNVDMTLDDRRINLVEQGVDVAIRVGELADSSLVARRIGSCRHVVCGSPAYFAEHGEPETPEQLGDHPALTYRYQQSPEEWSFSDPDGLSITAKVNSRMQFNNSLALREPLLQGAGVALIPTFVVGTDIQESRLSTVLTDYRALEVGIYAVYPQRRHLSPKVRVFLDFLAEHVSDPPYWEPGNSAHSAA